MAKIIVAAHPETGAVATPCKNKPDFVTVRVEKSTPSLTANGLLVMNKRTAFVTMQKEFVAILGLQDGKAFPMATETPNAVQKIVRKTSLTPFYEGQEPVINPETKAVITLNGAPLFQQYKYTEDSNEGDEFLDVIENAVVVTKETKALENQD